MDNSKKTADGRGIGVKNCEKFADVINGWSLTMTNCLGRYRQVAAFGDNSLEIGVSEVPRVHIFLYLINHGEIELIFVNCNA